LAQPHHYRLAANQRLFCAARAALWAGARALDECQGWVRENAKGRSVFLARSLSSDQADSSYGARPTALVVLARVSAPCRAGDGVLSSMRGARAGRRFSRRPSVRWLAGPASMKST